MKKVNVNQTCSRGSFDVTYEVVVVAYAPALFDVINYAVEREEFTLRC